MGGREVKPRTVEDWKIALDAIEWFQQQLRAKSPDEVRAWIAPPTVGPPQDVREIVEGLGHWLCHDESCKSENNDKYVGAYQCDCGLDRAITALSTLSRQSGRGGEGGGA
jgi:hypothetical protein